jgi:hypothetical protein
VARRPPWTGCRTQFPRPRPRSRIDGVATFGAAVVMYHGLPHNRARVETPGIGVFQRISCSSPIPGRWRVRLLGNPTAAGTAERRPFATLRQNGCGGASLSGRTARRDSRGRAPAARPGPQRVDRAIASRGPREVDRRRTSTRSRSVSSFGGRGCRVDGEDRLHVVCERNSVRVDPVESHTRFTRRSSNRFLFDDAFADRQFPPRGASINTRRRA